MSIGGDILIQGVYPSGYGSLKDVRCRIAASTPMPRGFHSTIDGENERMPAGGIIAKPKETFRSYYPYPRMRFGFIGRKPCLD